MPSAIERRQLLKAAGAAAALGAFNAVGPPSVCGTAARADAGPAAQAAGVYARHQPVRPAVRASRHAVMFNPASYQRSLMQNFDANGERVEITSEV